MVRDQVPGILVLLPVRDHSALQDPAGRERLTDAPLNRPQNRLASPDVVQTLPQCRTDAVPSKSWSLAHPTAFKQAHALSRRLWPT